MDNAIVEKIKKIVGEEYVTAGVADMEAYKHTAGSDYLHGNPEVAVLPRTTEQVAEIVKLANESRTPITPRGGGTGVFGTNIARYGGIMLDMSLMDKILQIDEDNMVVVAEAGCSVYKIMYELGKRGLAFCASPLYTSAVHIGSGVSTNMNGCHISRFGRLGDNLTGLEVVLPTGEIVTFGSGAYNNGYGYWTRYVGGPDLMGLFVNAGGTMGVVTKVAVRVKPKPAATRILAYGWRRDQAPPLAKALYWMQRDYVYDILLLNSWNFYMAGKLGKLQLPEHIHFVACVSVDGDDEEDLTHHTKKIVKTCLEYGGEDLGELGQHAMGAPGYKVWVSVSPWMQRTQGTYFYNPLLKFPEVYDTWEQSCRDWGVWNEDYVPAWFSFHDRNTMDPYPMLGISYPEDKQDLERVWNFLQDFNTRITKLGCTQYLLGDALPLITAQNLGPLYDFMLRVKRFVDPNNIMNPTKTYGGSDR
ncbi:MAG: FAD-binding oxidoreductase [Syntrophorhabdales bacterium]